MAVAKPPAAPRRNPFAEVIPDAVLASRYRRNRTAEIAAIVAAEYPGDHDVEPMLQLAALLPVYQEQAEAAARELARGSTAKVAEPPTKDEVTELRREVAGMVTRYRALGAVPKVDHDAHRAALYAALWSGGPQAAWSVYAEWLRAIVERHNAQQERAQLAEELGHAQRGIARRLLKPGDPLHPMVIDGVPDWTAEFAQAIARVPAPATKGDRS